MSEIYQRYLENAKTTLQQTDENVDEIKESLLQNGYDVADFHQVSDEYRDELTASVVRGLEEYQQGQCLNEENVYDAVIKALFDNPRGLPDAA